MQYIRVYFGTPLVIVIVVNSINKPASLIVNSHVNRNRTDNYLLYNINIIPAFYADTVVSDLIKTMKRQLHIPGDSFQNWKLAANNDDFKKHELLSFFFNVWMGHVSSFVLEE